MGGLLSELGKKLAERWLTLLVLPGALYLAVAVAGHALNHAHALDVGWLSVEVTDAAKSPQVSTLGGQVVLLLGVLAAAAAAGLTAQTIGTIVERTALAVGWRTWPWPLSLLVEQWVTCRQKRWDTAREIHDTLRLRELAPNPADRPSARTRHRTAHRQDRISVERPERPTWSGDRIHAAAVRLDRDLHLDLSTIWPHLWLVLPEQVRNEVTSARATLTRATTLAGWALLYLPLAWWWWPAAPIGAVLAVTAWRRIRAATDIYARVIEAAVRLYASDLATKLDIERSRPLNHTLGEAITRTLRAQF